MISGQRSSAARYRRKYGPAAAFVIARKKRGSKKLVWTVALHNIIARCTNPTANGFKFYGGIGICCHITKRHLWLAFLRDKAYLMKQPSVDRINAYGNYTPKNIRWIEMSINRATQPRKLLHDHIAKLRGIALPRIKCYTCSGARD